MQLTTVDTPEVIAVAFSPQNTYLITYQRPRKEAGNADKNLKVHLATGLDMEDLEIQARALEPESLQCRTPRLAYLCVMVQRCHGTRVPLRSPRGFST